jgi:D-lyxose ketol-isomerase
MRAGIMPARHGKQRSVAMSELSRREVIGGLIVGGAALVLPAGAARADDDIPGAARHGVKKYKNEDFYKDGKFDVKAAKEAYYKMMKSFEYPVMDRLRTDDFWTLDFNMGIFTEVGMAGIFWMNNKEHNYMGHDIYLLPGQMIPEHWHEKTESAAAKLEGWLVRNGTAYLYGEGTPTPGVNERISPSHRECAVARNEMFLKPGEIRMLVKPLEKHCMRAGPEGAIVTEFATYHDMAGLRFTHPKAKL